MPPITTNTKMYIEREKFNKYPHFQKIDEIKLKRGGARKGKK